MRPTNIRDKKVLLSPLNWGLGHVSRCIGLIQELHDLGNEVVVAANSDQQAIFRMYFPELNMVSHEGYPFEFGGKGNFAWDLTKKLAALKSRLKQEQLETESMVDKLGIEVVLSDHRYGFYSKQVPSVFITHQYHLPVSGLQRISDVWHKKRMEPFTYIWILDHERSPLSGKLTENISDERVLFVGPRSRFSLYPESKVKSGDVVVVSGPKIYAQQFATEMEEKYPSALFICPTDIELGENVRRMSGKWPEQDSAILQTNRLISRSGYSTIMDLEILKVSAELHSTPGQAEQIYLHQKLTDCSEYIPLALRGRSYE